MCVKRGPHPTKTMIKDICEQSAEENERKRGKVLEGWRKLALRA